MTLEFTILGAPVAKGRARSFARVVGRRVISGHFTPAKTRKAEETLAARAMQFRPTEPLRGPLRLELRFVLPVPASWPKWRQEAALSGLYRHVSTPDTSNYVKLAEDALNGVFWIDDSQICELVARKDYGAIPMTCVRIVELAQFDGRPVIQRLVERAQMELKVASDA